MEGWSVDEWLNSVINSTFPAFSGDGDLDDDREEDLSEKERKELTIVKLTS